MNESQKTALKLALMILLGSLLGFSPTFISVTQNAQKVQDAFQAGKYRAGAGYLLEIAQANPWWTALWESAGDAAFLSGDYPQAVSAYEESQRLNDLSESGQIKLGRAYLELGDIESAELAWQTLPESPEALKNLAELYETQDEFPRAIEVWNDYLALSEVGADPELVYYFGLLIAADTPPKALAYLDQASAEYPQAESVAAAVREALDQEPAYQLVRTGQALAAINYWRLAAHAFQKATLLRPDYQEAWVYWGEALQHLENPSRDPLEVLQQGLSLDESSPLANLFFGLYWQREGSHQTALDFFENAESSWPDQADVLVEAGKSLAALGELEAALAKYQAASALQPENDQYYRQLAQFAITYSYHVREIGLPAARLAVQLDSQEPANLDALGQVLLHLEDEMNALKLFQEALTLDPAYAPTYYHLGILFSARDSQEEALYYLQEAVRYSQNPALTDQAQRLLSTY